jgi:hypothetical protein
MRTSIQKNPDFSERCLLETLGEQCLADFSKPRQQKNPKSSAAQCFSKLRVQIFSNFSEGMES